MEIQIFKTDDLKRGTPEEIRKQYQLLKSKSRKLPYWVLDSWADMETAPQDPPLPQKSSIKTLVIKSLMNYCLPVFEGNPHLQAESGKHEGVWLQSDIDVRGVDLSFKEYIIPKNQKFRVVALYPQFRKSAGAHIIPITTPLNIVASLSLDEVYNSGNWGVKHPSGILMGTMMTPLPFAPPKQIFITEQIDHFVNEITHSVMWYLRHASMMYMEVKEPSVKQLAATKPQLIKLTPLARQLEQITGYKFGNVWRSSLVSDLINIGASDLYYMGEKKQQNALRQLQLIYDNLKNLREQAVKTQILNMKDALADVLAQKTWKKSRKDLDQDEMRILNDRVKSWHWEFENKADPANVLLRRLRHAIDSVSSVQKLEKIWGEVRELFGLGVVSGLDSVSDLMAPAANPDLKVLCPHMIDQVQQLLHLKPNAMGGVDSQSVIENIVHKWAEKAPVNYHYWCRICGELLYIDQLEDFNVFGPQTIVSSISDWDPLRVKVYGEVLQALRLIKFKKMVGRNMKSLISSITQTLDPAIQNIQVQLQNMKTKSVDDINMLTLLYISIYTFAFLSKMIIDNPDKMAWNVTVKGGKIDNRVAATLAVAYALVMNTKGTLISKIKDFSSEMIKPLLMTAYDYANKAKFQVTKDEDDTLGPEIITHMINTDSVFHYAEVIDRMSGGRGEPAKIFGIQKYSELCTPVPYAKLPRREGKNYFNDSWNMMLEFVNDIVPKKYNVVPLDPILQKWWQKWQYLLQDDKKRESQIAFKRIRPKLVLYRYVRPLDVLKDVYSSELYCPSGGKHDFSFANVIWVFKSDAGQLRLRLKDILNMQREGKWHGIKFDHEECARCGYAPGGKPADLTSILNEQIKKLNMFRYFENRCPAPNALFHEFLVDKDGFTGDQPCKACGFKRSMMENMPEPWYGKWKKSMSQSVIKTLDTTPTAYEPPSDTKWDKWGVTLASVLQVSKLSNIPYNVWVNLGLTEHRSFMQIKSSRINPQSQLSPQDLDARNVKLLNYIEHTRRTYYLIKNHAKTTVPVAIKQLLETETLQVKLQDVLGDIFVDLPQRLRWYMKTQTPAEVSNFLLHTLCSTLLNIRNLESKMKKFAVKMFDFICQSILRSETMLSELEVQTRYIAAPVTDTEQEEADDETYQQLGEQVDVSEKGTQDPFSMEDVDIENSNRGLEEEDFMD